MSSSELAVVYATLILHDDGCAPDAEKMATLITAAGIEIEPIWCKMFEKALEGKDIGEFLMNVGSGAMSGGGAAPAAGGDAPAEKVEEKKVEEEEEESDDDIGMFLYLVARCLISFLI